MSQYNVYCKQYVAESPPMTAFREAVTRDDEPGGKKFSR